MKKLILVLAMLSLMGAFVIATVDQDTSVDVLADLTMTPAPLPLAFGPIVVGGNSIKPVTLTPGNSDLSISVEISGDSLMQSIGYDFNGIGSFIPLKGTSFTLIRNTAKVFNTQLTIPPGTIQKSYNGTIVYTVNEYVPITG